MKPLNLTYCPVERKPCIRWIQQLFQDCLCNFKDEVSFAFGIASLVCWAIAEIPQIITNFQNKSATGVSLVFLSTWIIGDVFNLVGCILEPATLPTQFYTAVLYTTVTIVLALQCIYYKHFIQWWNPHKIEANWDGDSTNNPLQSEFENQRKTIENAPIDVPRWRDFHFMSARSLAGSDTPPVQCYIKAKSGPPALGYYQGSSSEEEKEEDESITSNIPPHSNIMPVSQPRPIPRRVKYGTFAAASANFPRLSRAIRGVADGTAKLSGSRSFLQEYEVHENAYGQCLGWLMAAIYMGGRIPQIWLNIKRGSVEGLNPLMFVFALIANGTYVGSILMRSTEWRIIKANFPWLLDAIVCVLLDLFIILQYVFYKYVKRKRIEHSGEYYGEYVEADKPT